MQQGAVADVHRKRSVRHPQVRFAQHLQCLLVELVPEPACRSMIRLDSALMVMCTSTKHEVAATHIDSFHETARQ